MPSLDTPALILVLVALASYLVGSIPFGMIIARLFGLGDLRKIGSGNIGATNVLRTGSKPAAALTLLLDGGKAAAPVLAGRAIGGEDAAQLAGLAAFLGHLFPVWLKFHGGKGVASYLGATLAVAPLLGVMAIIAWLFTAFVYRISSLAALMATLILPPLAWMTGYRDVFVFLMLMGGLVWIRHAHNIQRLRDGTEPRIGTKKTG